MEKIPFVSIIIPMYNVEQYIERCLNSVISQDFTDYEVILINDGSKDNSLRIAESYSDKYEKIRLVSQENKGVSAVRNLGVSMAKGKYLAFVDSDDYIMPDFLSIMCGKAVEHDADIVSCNYFNGNSDGTAKVKNFIYRREGVYGKETILKSNIKEFSVRNYLWNKLWRRTLFTENNIVFPTMVFEDASTTPKLFYHANKTVIIKDCLYQYTQRRDSLTGFGSPRCIRDYLTSFGLIRTFLEGNNSFKPYRFSFKILRLKVAFTVLTWVIVWAFVSKKPLNFVKNTKQTVSYLSYYSGNKYVHEDLAESDGIHIPVVL